MIIIFYVNVCNIKTKKTKTLLSTIPFYHLPHPTDNTKLTSIENIE